MKKYSWHRKKLKPAQLCLVLPKDISETICETEVDNDIYRAEDGFWYEEKKMDEDAELGDAEESPCIFLEDGDGMALKACSINDLKGKKVEEDLECVFFSLDIDGTDTENAIKADGTLIRSIKDNEPIDQDAMLSAYVTNICVWDAEAGIKLVPTAKEYKQMMAVNGNLYQLKRLLQGATNC